MTRETKIGLLVGLAFIILIGILLSDHLAINSEANQAQLAQANTAVQQGLGSPVPAPQGNTLVVPPGPMVAPPSPIITQQEMNNPQRGPSVIVLGGNNNPGTATTLSNPVPNNGDTGVINIGPGTYGNTAPIVINGGQQQSISTPQNPVPQTDVLSTINGGPVPDDLQRAVQQAGFGTQTPTPVAQGIGPVNPVPPTPVAANTRQYTVKSGDSLSKIAAAFYGRGDKANMQRIIDANPALKKNPNMIVVGQTYVIPNIPAPTPAVNPTPAPAGQQTPAPLPAVAGRDSVTPTETRTPSAQQAADHQTPAETVYYYTVKESDTLWKIATVQLGDGAKAKEIMAMNKDVLNGGDTIRVGQKLRLPARPLADVR